MENITPKDEKVMVKAMNKATKKVAGITKRINTFKPVVLSKGLYQASSKEFYAKFPEIKAMLDRLGKEGYGFFRVEVTCSPTKKPTAKIVNIIKHNAPDDWSNK